VSHQVFIARIFAAFILGMLIGIERQWRQRMAGLRTNTLVCVGSAIFVALTGLTQGETTRIAGQVVTGIGFLGAGVNFR
jgi:putative Mg2+ transporter-C (MgtC) family protein